MFLPPRSTSQCTTDFYRQGRHETFRNHRFWLLRTSLPLYQNVLILLCLKELGCITPLVLLPSERLSGSGVGAYNRPTLVDDSPSGSG